MDRDVVLVCLALVLGGAATAAASSWARRRAVQAAAQDEAAAWRRLWLPLTPAAAAWSFLLGWAVQEPDLSDERLGLAWLSAAALFGMIVARAVVRTVRSAASRRTEAAATVGLLSPRVVIAPGLLSRLDDEAIRAVLEHEAAHARHRDPFRVLVGQLAADLQWPLPGTLQRFSEWRHALELARDDEARLRGAYGPDLAHAILVTANMRRSVSGATPFSMCSRSSAWAAPAFPGTS